MQGESAFKLGSILLLIGLAVSAAQFASEAQAVTSLESQSSQNLFSQSSEADSQAKDSATLMKALGLSRKIQEEIQASREVEQINNGKFKPFQVGN